MHRAIANSGFDKGTDLKTINKECGKLVKSAKEQPCLCYFAVLKQCFIEKGTKKRLELDAGYRMI
jgi:hypothetical protein